MGDPRHPGTTTPGHPRLSRGTRIAGSDADPARTRIGVSPMESVSAECAPRRKPLRYARTHRRASRGIVLPRPPSTLVRPLDRPPVAGLDTGIIGIRTDALEQPTRTRRENLVLRFCDHRRHRVWPSVPIRRPVCIGHDPHLRKLDLAGLTPWIAGDTVTGPQGFSDLCPAPQERGTHIILRPPRWLRVQP